MWSRAVHTTVALGIAAGCVLTVLGVLLSPQILRWIGTPADVIQNSILYFRIYFLGCSAVVLYNMAASILQSVGDSRSPMKYLILASLTNVALDLLFVAVLDLGVGSAALATIISQVLSASLALGRLTRTDRSYRIRWRRVRFEGVMLRQVVTLGVPSGVQNSVVSLANVIVQANINAFGSSAMAGCGAYSKIEGFAFLPVTCFALALSTFVSQNIGAQRYDRVRAGMKFGLLCSPILAECIGVGIFFLSPVLVSAFNNQPEVVAFGVNYAHTVSLFYCLLAFSHCCAGIMRGHGPPHRAHDHHALRVVRSAYHLHHPDGPGHPVHPGGLLGLPADLDHQLDPVRLLSQQTALSPYALPRTRALIKQGVFPSENHRQAQPGQGHPVL